MHVSWFNPIRWYSNEKQIEPKSQTRQHLFIIGLEDNIKGKTSAHIEQSFSDLSFCLSKISYNNIHNKIRCWLQCNTRTRGVYEQVYHQICTQKKKEKLNIRQLEEVISSDSSSNEGSTAIENLIVYPRRGALKKKRFKESHKLENMSNAKQSSEGQKTRKPTQCQQCQNTGHNKTSCEGWHKRQGISYLY
ncbi:hypothetical protein F8M41_010494 [Gigaspora margarita]|uniref:Uncharacterized protein n=1 Tax=Gigaspora margarita TaxID=4874 RepID=A0A8H3X251_GIGMA|nr:hypothetical protein F8M41_010494 [Gigaspora margarita]